MKRLRSFAIAACAAMVLAMAVGASTAGAAAFYVDQPSPGYTAVNGTQIQPVSTFGFQSTSFLCTGQNFSDAPLDDPSTTLSPTSMVDGNCSASGTHFIMKMNGCRTIFHADHTMDIGPAGCGPISLKTPYSCEMTIPAQTGLPGVEYSNEKGMVEINLTTYGMKYTQKGKCTEGTFTDGLWNSRWQAAGFDGGLATPLHFGPVPTGIFVSPEYKLDAEGFPVSLSGSQPAKALHKFGTAYGTSVCENAQFSGEPSAASSEVSLVPSYSSCSSNGLSGTTVAMNGCAYVAHIAGSGPPYTGTADIACPAGKSMEIIMKVLGTTKCTWTIGAQSGLSGLTFTNSGSWMERKVTVGYNLSGISYHQQEGSGLGKCTTGDYANGTYQGEAVLTGTRFS